jgi:hypothetical protein
VGLDVSDADAAMISKIWYSHLTTEDSVFVLLRDSASPVTTVSKYLASKPSFQLFNCNRECHQEDHDVLANALAPCSLLPDLPTISMGVGKRYTRYHHDSNVRKNRSKTTHLTANGLRYQQGAMRSTLLKHPFLLDERRPWRQLTLRGLVLLFGTQEVTSHTTLCNNTFLRYRHKDNRSTSGVYKCFGGAWTAIISREWAGRGRLGRFIRTKLREIQYGGRALRPSLGQGQGMA